MGLESSEWAASQQFASSFPDEWQCANHCRWALAKTFERSWPPEEPEVRQLAEVEVGQQSSCGCAARHEQRNFMMRFDKLAHLSLDEVARGIVGRGWVRGADDRDAHGRTTAIAVREGRGVA